MSEEAMSKIMKRLDAIESRLGHGAEIKLENDESEQGYDTPIDDGEGPGNKKKIFIAAMKKKMMGGK